MAPYWHDRAMADLQKEGEAKRRADIAARRAEREAAQADGVEAPHSVHPIPRRTLMLVGAAGLAVLGMGASLVSPVAALVFLLPAVALGGYAWRQPGVSRPARRSASSDPVTRAYEEARRTLDQSPRLDTPKKVELLAVLDGSYRKIEDWEVNRSELEQARRELDGSDASEAKALRSALANLERRRSEFVAQCDSLRRSVTALDLQAGTSASDDELVAAARDLEAEVSADAELAEALRAARAPVGHERA